jgi:hypothetical protein
MKESEDAKQVKELDKSKITMILQMFWSAVYKNIKIDYVLVDSRFTCDALIQAIREAEVHLIDVFKFRFFIVPQKKVLALKPKIE